ncbi:MAG TPA: molybdopterin cofactor-binding domain-containing protein, partial [Acidimicrobiales bacterium]|nr:molybdopterin cofactor-binding domain-containing protein [Acidimicrobiales bacterium]
PRDALRDEVVLHPDAGTNVALELAFGRDDSLFDGCEVVVRQRINNQRVAPCPLETRAAAATFEDGRLTHWATTQSPHSVKTDLCRFLGFEDVDVRVIAPDVGGGFGAKIGVYAEELLVAWFARRLGRPVRWSESRSESMVGLGHGRGQIQDVTLGGTRDGKVTAYRLHVLQDAGAYPKIGAVLPWMTRMMLTGVYDIAKGEFNSTSVVTNTTPTVAYRGAGRPEAAAAIERTMDVFAAELAMDPAEVRRRNFIGADAFPFTTPTGTVYDIGDYGAALDRVLEAAGYAELRSEQQRRRDAGETVQLGIGLAVYVEVTGGNPGEYASVEVRGDGSVLVKTGTSPHGQGHETAWAMLVSDQLGIPMDAIKVVHGDTDVVPRGNGTMGSRSLQIGGVAVNQASVTVLELARQRAADLFEADPADIVLDKSAGGFHVAGTPSLTKSWTEVAAASEEPLAAEVDFSPEAATFPFGAHVAVVDVDIETGHVRLARMVACDDAGRIINPLLADGQIHGGLAQGVAQALLEEIRYDADGNPITSNFADYAFISAAELPSFETIRMETPTPLNALGAKGIGESGTIGSTPAVHNAVVDAVSYLGVRHIDMPCTAQRVWEAIEAAHRGDPPDELPPLLNVPGDAAPEDASDHEIDVV